LVVPGSSSSSSSRIRQLLPPKIGNAGKP
jgi:hypothetical protein